MGTISKNFSFSEFERSATAEHYHLDNHITSQVVEIAIRELVATVLQPLRDSLEAPVYINSGYRTARLNALLPNSSRTSQHMKGEAADIRTDACTPLWIARRIVDLKLPFDQLILYPTFVHVSHKAGGPQRGQILYNRSYVGPCL